MGDYFILLASSLVETQHLTHIAPSQNMNLSTSPSPSPYDEDDDGELNRPKDYFGAPPPLKSRRDLRWDI